MEISNFINADIVDKQDKNEQQKVTDVHIGVFFDGTGNNMLQKTFYEKQMQKDYGVVGNWLHYEKGEWVKLKKESIQSLKRVINEPYPKDKDIEELLKIASGQDKFNSSNSAFSAKRIEEERKRLGSIQNRRKNILKYYAYEEITGLGDEEISKMSDDEILQFLNQYHKAMPNTSKGYSNVGILYDYYNLGESKKDNCLYHHFYIEGSGATDLTSSGKTSIGGLGFGVNPTGVVGLVSKAVKYSATYVESVKALLATNNVTIHFYLFGFSRGSACARLFSHLLTRAKQDPPLECEDEFSKYYAKNYYKSDPVNGKNSRERIRFLDDYNKVVDFLGIYDTVASIGFLKQKDGHVHPLHLIYILNGDYRGNWHYNNVREYGLYINDKKVKYTCQIGAMDEFRENFAFVDVGKVVPSNAIEIFIPGCHSDVGGGYIDGQEEQEIELKYFERHKKRTSVFIESPQITPASSSKMTSDDNNKTTELLSKESLEKLGWIDENWKNDNKAVINIDGNEEPLRSTIRVYDDGKKRILFKRNVKGGYSNIALKMMMKCCEECKYNLFKYKSSDDLPAYEIPVELKNLGLQMINQVVTPNGQRKWLYPEGKYCSNQYRWLRMHFLHFTCTTMAHMNWIGDDYVRKNEEKTFDKYSKARKNETNMGNIGNPPNYDMEGRLCRIVYHGDNVKIKHSDIEYMYDYNKNDVVPISL